MMVVATGGYREIVVDPLAVALVMTIFSSNEIVDTSKVHAPVERIQERVNFYHLRAMYLKIAMENLKQGYMQCISDLHTSLSM